MNQPYDIDEVARTNERHLVTKAFLQVLLVSGLINTANAEPIVGAVNDLLHTMRTAERP